MAKPTIVNEYCFSDETDEKCNFCFYKGDFKCVIPCRPANRIDKQNVIYLDNVSDKLLCKDNSIYKYTYADMVKITDFKGEVIERCIYNDMNIEIFVLDDNRAIIIKDDNDIILDDSISQVTDFEVLNNRIIKINSHDSYNYFDIYSEKFLFHEHDWLHEEIPNYEQLINDLDTFFKSQC